MTHNFSRKLIVAISSRALFNLDESHEIFEKQGIAAYAKYQMENENNILEPGVAFSLVKKLLILKDPKSNESLVEVILLSHNSADTGLRVFNSIKHYQLNIVRAAFTTGASTYRYVTAFGADLFLSANTDDVKYALQQGCAAATILQTNIGANSSDQLRIAFDGDAVIFSDEAERIYQQDGLDAFAESEFAAAQTPLAGGPFKGFLFALHQIQTKFPADNCPIRTALVTARSAPAHERVIRTLRAWNIRIDEALFLGGLSKGEFLRAFGADFYFDDQQGHCDSAREHVATGHVPHGVVNEKKGKK
jgi:5'-nucleotidase